MQLRCPHCKTEYNIAENSIPETGRVIQCALCDNTWYRTHPAQVVATPSSLAGAPDASPEGGDAEGSARAEAEADEARADKVEPKLTPLDKDVARVLREEREHEAFMRRQQTAQNQEAPHAWPALSSEPDAAKGEGGHAPQASVASLPPEPQVQAQADAPAAQSEWRANRGSKRRFLRGFFLTLVLAICVLWVAMGADHIIQAVPFLAPGVNAIRTLVESIGGAAAKWLF
ncbi:MAG: zinc-ribbon domain-containing protein [Rhodobacteraceae bacterium]|nr:zinc-ribbon domain-containing protein [Paracoccaceae bacterium]